MPDNELMSWTGNITNWIEWYDYVAESSSWYEAQCPEYIKDSPDLYSSWLNAQKNKDKLKGR
jgi:hypothetical protein